MTTTKQNGKCNHTGNGELPVVNLGSDRPHLDSAEPINDVSLAIAVGEVGRMYANNLGTKDCRNPYGATLGQLRERLKLQDGELLPKELHEALRAAAGAKSGKDASKHFDVTVNTRFTSKPVFSAKGIASGGEFSELRTASGNRLLSLVEQAEQAPKVAESYRARAKRLCTQFDVAYSAGMLADARELFLRDAKKLRRSFAAMEDAASKLPGSPSVGTIVFTGTLGEDLAKDDAFLAKAAEDGARAKAAADALAVREAAERAAAKAAKLANEEAHALEQKRRADADSAAKQIQAADAKVAKQVAKAAKKASKVAPVALAQAA